MQSITSSHCFCFIRIASVSRVIPALFTSTPTGESYASAVALKRDAMPSGCDMSACTAMPSPPSALISSHTASAAAAELA